MYTVKERLMWLVAPSVRRVLQRPMRLAAGVAGEDTGCSTMGDKAFIEQEVSRMYIIVIKQGVKVKAEPCWSDASTLEGESPADCLSSFRLFSHLEEHQGACFAIRKLIGQKMNT